MADLIPTERIESKIFIIRGQKVMIDRDLAGLYQVSTKALNQAVKRNIERFPYEFMFKLTQIERDELVTNCDQFRDLKFHYGISSWGRKEKPKRRIGFVE